MKLKKGLYAGRSVDYGYELVNVFARSAPFGWCVGFLETASESLGLSPQTIRRLLGRSLRLGEVVQITGLETRRVGIAKDDGDE